MEECVQSTAIGGAAFSAMGLTGLAWLFYSRFSEDQPRSHVAETDDV
jgi:hypothetical protein